MRLGCRQLARGDRAKCLPVLFPVVNPRKLKGEKLEVASGPGFTFSVGRRVDVSYCDEATQDVGSGPACE